MEILEQVFSTADQIMSVAKEAYFFKNKCFHVSTFLHENINQMKKIVIKENNQEQIRDLLNLLEKLFKKIKKIRDSNIFWVYLNGTDPIQKLITDINKYMKNIHPVLKELGVKDLTKVQPDYLYDDYARIDDYLANSQILINERRKEVGKYLKQNHSKFTEPLFESVDLENINELNNKYSEKKVNKCDFQQNEQIAYSNDVFTYYLGKEKKNGKDVTILKLKNDRKHIFKRLISVLTRINHEYVESFIGSYIENSEVTIITNRCGEPLSNYLHHHSNYDTFSFRPGDRTILAFKIAEGMSYLHSRRIIHRNLITSSIYIIPSEDPNAEICPMICGFRDSRFMKQGSSYSYSVKRTSQAEHKTHPFFAPEHYDNHTYDEKVDVFAFSGILFELVTNCAPFSCFDTANVREDLKAGKRPVIPETENISDDLKNLIKSCWANHPKDRISFDEIIDLMLSKNIVFPEDQSNEKVVLDFYAKKRIKSYSAHKCIEMFMMIKKDIGNAFQYRFELLRARPILHNYQYLLRESQYAKEEFLEPEIEEKMEELSYNLENLSFIVADSLEDNWIDKLERIKVFQITEGITKYMFEIYKSMQSLGFVDIPKYEESKDDLIFDYRELENYFTESIDKTNFFLKENRLDQNTLKVYKIKRAEIQQFLSDKKLNDFSSKALRERIKDLLSPFQPYELKSDDYEIDQTENPRSTYISSVYKGKTRKTGKIVAIKIIKEEYLNQGEKQLIFLRREIGYLTRLKHKYIAKFIGYVLPNDKNEIWLISEYYTDGTLYDRLNTQIKELILSPTDKTKIAFKIAEIMKYLHANKILHLDLKSSNILMKGKTPKLIDFGFSCSDNDALKIISNSIGTYSYMAPEIIKNQNYDSKADVFSYSMLLWEIYSNKAPYENDSNQELIKHKISDDVELEFNEKILDKLKGIIKKGYSSNPSKRPSFNDIINLFMNYELYFDGTDINEIKTFYDKKREKLRSQKQMLQQTSTVRFPR